MNTLNQNFAARLAASSPTVPAFNPVSAPAGADGTSNPGASFSAQLRRQDEQASRSPAPAARDKPAEPEGNGRRARKATEAPAGATAGNSLPLPGSIPPVVAPVVAPVVPPPAATASGAAAPADEEPGPAGSHEAAPAVVGAATTPSAAAVASAAAAQLGTADSDSEDPALPAGAADAGAPADPAAALEGAKALAALAALKSQVAAPVSAAKTAVTAAASAAAVPAAALPRDLSIKPARPLAAGVARVGASAVTADDAAASVASTGVAVAPLRITPDTTATIAQTVAMATLARDASGGDATAAKQDDLPAVDAAAPTTGVPLVPLLDPTGGSAAPAQAATIPSAPAVHVPVGSPDWGKQVGESVTWAANQNLTHATISLNPDHLGPLEIRLSLVGGEASVAFSTHSHAAAEALQASSGQLRDMLGQAGFTQVNVDISQQSGKQQSFAGSAYRESGGNSNGPAAVADVISAPTRSVSRSQLDAYA